MAEDLDKALLKAAERGETAQVRALLARGVPADPRPEGEDSPLCYAVMFGHLETARALLDAGAAVNHRGQYGRAPLHYATPRGLALTSLVLERGADVHARQDGDDDALDEFVTQKGTELAVVTRLLEAGLHPEGQRTRYYQGRTHLMWACFCGRPDVAEVLLAAGANPNAGNVLQEIRASMDKATAPRLLAAVVRAGIAPNAENGLGGETVLMAVCRAGDVESATRLLDRGADPNLRRGGTALTCAEESGNRVLVDLLLERGARPERPALAPGVAEALEQAEREARAAPLHGAKRLAWAEVLAAQGFRAAAAHELAAALALGAAPSARLLAALEFEKPEGVRWRLEATAGDFVAKPVDDARFPGASARSGDQVLPLVVLLGKFCARCDAQGETTCTQCDGTGSRPSFLSDGEESCDVRETCSSCGGLKYVVNTFRFGKGGCQHRAPVNEAEGRGYLLERCPDCGLAALSCGGLWSGMWACGVCGQFECRCNRG